MPLAAGQPDPTRILSNKAAAAAWQLLFRRLARYLDAGATSDRARHMDGSDLPAAASHAHRRTSGYRQAIQAQLGDTVGLTDAVARL